MYSKNNSSEKAAVLKSLGNRRVRNNLAYELAQLAIRSKEC